MAAGQQVALTAESSLLQAQLLTLAALTMVTGGAGGCASGDAMFAAGNPGGVDKNSCGLGANLLDIMGGADMCSITFDT